MPNAPWLPGERPWHVSGGRPVPVLADLPERHRQPRRITQLCGSAEGLHALCDDGSVWQLIAGAWRPEPGIPQRRVAEGEL